MSTFTSLLPPKAESSKNIFSLLSIISLWFSGIFLFFFFSKIKYQRLNRRCKGRLCAVRVCFMEKIVKPSRGGVMFSNYFNNFKGSQASGLVMDGHVPPGDPLCLHVLLQAPLCWPLIMPCHLQVFSPLHSALTNYSFFICWFPCWKVGPWVNFV